MGPASRVCVQSEIKYGISLFIRYCVPMLKKCLSSPDLLFPLLQPFYRV